ncbi:MAG: ASKHA domain-containing protein, partial [Blautia stercoris]
MFKVTFKFEGAEDVITYAQEGENLLEIARKSNVAIDAPCSGNASCGKCRVKLIGGEIESPKTRHITDEEYAEGWRLACVSKVTGDVEVQVPDIASAYRSRMKVADLSSKEEIAIFEKAKSDVESAGISLTNSLDVINVKMNVPTLDDTMPDNERLVRAIKKQTGIKKVRMPYSVLRKISYVFRESNFEVQCVIRSTENDIFIYDVYKKDEKVVIGGLAVDIGTTTVSALLIDMKSGEILGKASSGNGQIRYGADVINRIIESMKPGGSEKLQKAVIQETINPMIQQMCRASGFKPEHIYRLSIASNTTMNHLLTGMNGDPIRMEPYIPTFYKTNSLFASDIGIQVNPDAHIIMAPNIGSYVGGDITAGTLVSMLWNRPEFSLFIDLGTNGELVFGNSDFMMSCACSAGPAFEGGD